ncbi:hypothetical protein EDB85DRAFT_2207016 [Lactarius pseudohatsudake]|nr:hypothetical protein EDB85DRAFT_2207016 [Lactarius pseudohatsudake]
MPIWRAHFSLHYAVLWAHPDPLCEIISAGPLLFRTFVVAWVVFFRVDHVLGAIVFDAGWHRRRLFSPSIALTGAASKSLLLPQSLKLEVRREIRDAKVVVCVAQGASTTGWEGVRNVSCLVRSGVVPRLRGSIRFYVTLLWCFLALNDDRERCKTDSRNDQLKCCSQALSCVVVLTTE